MKVSEIKKLGKELYKEYTTVDAKVDNATVSRMAVFANFSNEHDLYKNEEDAAKVLAAAFPGDTRTAISARSDYKRVMLAAPHWDAIGKAYETLQSKSSTKIHRWQFTSRMCTAMKGKDTFDNDKAKDIFDKMVEKAKEKVDPNAKNGPLKAATLKRWIKALEKEAYRGKKASAKAEAIESLQVLAALLAD